MKHTNLFRVLFLALVLFELSSTPLGNKVTTDLEKTIRKAYIESGKETEYAMIYYTRGLAYNSLKNYEKAILDFTESIKIDPSSRSYYVRGRIYETLKRYDEAIRDYDEAIKLDPDFEAPYYNKLTIRDKLESLQ